MKSLPTILAAVLVLTAVLLAISGSLPSGGSRDAGISEAASPPASPRFRQRALNLPGDGAPERTTEATSCGSDAPPLSPADPGSSSSATAGRAALSAGQRKAAEFRRQLRRDGERFDEAIGAHVVLQPAAWVDLGEDASLPPEHQDGIQQIAAELRDKIAASGLDPASPEYRKLWNDAVRESNWKFRARYGARAWARHHIQAHHMASQQTNRN